MRKFTILIVTLLSVSLLVSCSKGNSNDSPKGAVDKIENTSDNKESLDFKKQLDEARKRIEDLEKQVDQLQKQNYELKQVDLKTTKTLEVDLNFDGDKEFIKLECDEWGNVFTLSINQLSITSYGSNIDREIVIVDIDKKDKVLEIAIPESGPSDDLFTSFYRYTGNNIDFIGKIGGKPGAGLTVNGDGTVTATTRGNILHTWFYKDEYMLAPNHSLIRVEPVDGLYSMGEYKVKVIKSIPIYRAPNREVLKELRIGEEVKLMATDDKELVLLETQDGEQGWIMIEGFWNIKGTKLNAGEVFEGLSMAD